MNEDDSNPGFYPKSSLPYGKLMKNSLTLIKEGHLDSIDQLTFGWGSKMWWNRVQSQEKAKHLKSGGLKLEMGPDTTRAYF